MNTADRVYAIHDRLRAVYGPQHWWPADSPWEVIVGAILTQSAAWTNVEKAIANLKDAGILSPAGIHATAQDELARLVYPSGYYNAKARKLKSFAQRLHDGYQGELDALFAFDLASLRAELLSIHGVGPETADSIILYAAGKPSFVIDAYTRRIACRLGLAAPTTNYPDLQALFTDCLPLDAPLYNEFHALLVHLGKEACRKRPMCPKCPLYLAPSLCPGFAAH
jgi:endonuclease III related protein